MALCKHGKSPITNSHNHWWDSETEMAECTKCKEVLSYSKYHKHKGKHVISTHRPVLPMCKKCEKEVSFANRRKNIKHTKYIGYKNVMRSEGNDCDITYEEFLEYWPWDNRCPILGHELKTYPEDEREKWIGGRHYPFTPCVDHIDPRLPMSRNNLQIICWRANELKSDAIPAEIHLLHKHMEDVFPVGDEIFESMGYKNTLKESGWVGKYTNMD